MTTKIISASYALYVVMYGHFGRPELRLPWEKANKTPELKKLT